MDIKKIIREEIEKLNEEIQSDLVLPKGKRVVLQADNPKVNRGLVVTWLEKGGYDVEYWYKDPSKIYPAEVIIDGKPITKDGKVVHLGYHPELDEGFGSDEFLTKTEKKKFEKERLENAEVLGYTLTGTKDLKESTIQEKTFTPIDKIKDIKNLVKKGLVSYRGTGGGFEISIRNKKVPGFPPAFSLLQKDEKKYKDIMKKQFKIKPVEKFFIKSNELTQLKKFGTIPFLAPSKKESVNEDVFAIVDKFNQSKQDYDQVYFKDNNLNKVKNHLKKLGKKYGKMNLIRVKTNGKMSLVESVNEDGHTDVPSAVRKLKTSIEDALQIIGYLKKVNDAEPLPSWWTDKVTLSSNYLNTARNYILNPHESVFAVRQDKIKNGERFPKEPNFDYDPEKGKSRIRKVNEGSAVIDTETIKVVKFTRVKANSPLHKHLKDITKKVGANVKKIHGGYIVNTDNDEKKLSAVIDYVKKKMKKSKVNEGKGVDKIMKMADDYSYGKIAGKTVDVMTAKLFQAVYKKASQKARDRVDKMNEKQLYIFMMNLWKKFGKQLTLSS